MIKNTITNDYEFWEWIRTSDNYKNNHTVDGAKAVQEYYEQLSDDLGEDIEFDPIAWCCEWSEYESLDKAFEDYADNDKLENYEDKLSYFEDRTQVIELDNGGVLIQAF